MRTTSTVRLAMIFAIVAAVLTTGGTTPGVHAQAGARERTIFVSAVDARGEPVEGLDVTDFVVTEDGRRREILRVSRAIEPMDIALLVDNSSAADDAVPWLRDGLKDFLTALGGNHQIALIALADRPTIFVDYTSNRTQLERGIGRLFPMGGSGMTLLDALIEVSEGLRRRDATRAVVVPVITNGAELGDRSGAAAVRALRDAGVSLHALVIGVPGFETFPERERAIVLDTGTRETGGQHVTLLAETGLKSALEKLARQLSSQYKVMYGRPESLIPPEQFAVTSGRAGVTMRGTQARGQAGS